MKPIILKAVTGSVFLLVVASALYFFTRTIFVYQERSKADSSLPTKIIRLDLNSLQSINVGSEVTVSFDISAPAGSPYRVNGVASMTVPVQFDSSKLRLTSVSRDGLTGCEAFGNAETLDLEVINSAGYFLYSKNYRTSTQYPQAPSGEQSFCFGKLTFSAVADGSAAITVNNTSALTGSFELTGTTQTDIDIQQDARKNINVVASFSQLKITKNVEGYTPEQYPATNTFSVEYSCGEGDAPTSTPTPPQDGGGGTNPTATPTINPDPNDGIIRDASAGGYFTCVLANGKPKCWGINNFGQLNIPADLTGGTSAIYSGLSTGCAIVNGGVRCWGWTGNLGELTVPANLTSGVTKIGIGNNRACAMKDSSLVCWGAADSAVPTDISAISSSITSMSVGAFHVCVLTNGGAIKCWGTNGGYGELSGPSAISSGATAVAAGYRATCAVVNGEIRCWGWGLSSTQIPTTPQGTTVTQLDVGERFACARWSNGSVKCWGLDSEGSVIGVNGAQINSGATKVTVGNKHTCVLYDNNSVSCWGSNAACPATTPNCITIPPSPLVVNSRHSQSASIKTGAESNTLVQDNKLTKSVMSANVVTLGNGQTTEYINLGGQMAWCNVRELGGTQLPAPPTGYEWGTPVIETEYESRGSGVTSKNVNIINKLVRVTPTTTSTPTKTPTVTPYAGEPAPVCTNHSNCGSRPYYVLIERKDQEDKPIYDLRYYDVNEELPSDAIYNVVANGIVVEPPTTIASGEFLLNAAPFRYATIPFQYLFRVKVQDTTTAKNMKIYVGSANMTPPPWTVKTEEQGGITYKVFHRPGLTEIATPTPTVTRTPTPTPEGFNLYIDPVGTDPELDAVELRLETGVRQGARRGERFSMRIVASPKNTNLRSEFIFLKEVKIPVQYALPVNPNSIILESIRTTNNAECRDYRLDDPQEDEIGSVSAFYLRAVFESSAPKQLAADTCIAEFTFDVKDNAQYNDSATVKMLTEEESEGIGEIDTIPAMMGMHALAYHLVRNAPTTTPAVTPATIHPKVNLSYDMANRSKTVTVDTSRSVAPNAPDLIVENVDLIRTEAVTPTVCGPVKIRVVVKNQGQSAADPFSISVNGQKKASTQSEPSVSNGGLEVGATKTYYFDKIKFNADGPNTIFVDSEDKVIELREDNNYVNKKFVFADIPGNTDTQCPNPTNTPTNTPTPTSLTPTPTYTPNPNMINLILAVRLQGVGSSTFSKQFSKLKFGVAVGGGRLTENTEYVYNDFVYKGDGKYEGIVSFDPAKVAVGSGYRIIVKGPKHLAKRFCVAAPTGGYAYFCPANTANISLRKGINNFDFTNVQLIAGDIPNGEQDGVVDSSDLAFIRDNLGIKLPEIIKIGDLNLDGIIDTQDYSMVINNLVNNEDEN